MRFITLFIAIILTTSCMHRSTEDIFADAYNDFFVIVRRYHTFLELSDAELVEEARLLARNNNLPTASFLWQTMLGNDHVTTSQGAPLHKAVYLMQKDIDLLDHNIHLFERRGLFDRRLYAHMRDLRRDLLLWQRIIEKQKSFSQEAQFIEGQRLQKTQLYEQQKQTRLLEEMNKSSRSCAC